MRTIVFGDDEVGNADKPLHALLCLTLAITNQYLTMPNIDPALWRDMMAHLRKRHSSICRQWFEELEPTDLKGGLLQIATSNSVQEKYLQSKCLDQFNEAAQAVTGALIGIRFITRDRHVDKPDTEDPDIPPKVTITASVTPKPKSATQSTHPAQKTRTSVAGSDFNADQMVLSPDYSFQNFVTGPNNQLAYAASVAVANQPGTAYNPISSMAGSAWGKPTCSKPSVRASSTTHPTPKFSTSPATLL